jgi:hypothetical protein
MMNTVRHTFHTIGDRSGDLARSFGSGTADIARRVGGGTTSLARQIGPRRALIGLAVAAIAIGGSVVLIRYLRSRRAQDATGADRNDELTGAGSRPVDLSRSSTEFRSSY